MKFQIFRSLRKSCWNNLLLDQISSQRRIVVYSSYSPLYFVFFVIFTTFIRQTNAENIFSFLEWSFFLFSNCFSSFSRIVFLPFLEWSFFLFSNDLSSFSRIVFLPFLELSFFLFSNGLSSFSRIIFLPFLEWSFFLFSNCLSSFSRMVFLPSLEWSFFLFSNSLSSFSPMVFFQMAGHERRGRRKNERTDAPENHLSNRNVRTNSSRSDYRLFGRKINLVNDFLSRFPWKWKAFTLVPFFFFFFASPCRRTKQRIE